MFSENPLLFRCAGGQSLLCLEQSGRCDLPLRQTRRFVRPDVWYRSKTGRRPGSSKMIETTLQNNQPIPTAVVSRPGIMQQSLRASLAACPWIAVVASFGDGLSALNHLAKFHPGILVINSNLLDEEVDALLDRSEEQSNRTTRCLVLARSSARNEQVLIHGAHAPSCATGQPRNCRKRCLGWRRIRSTSRPETRSRGPGE